MVSRHAVAINKKRFVSSGTFVVLFKIFKYQLKFQATVIFPNTLHHFGKKLS